MKKLIIKHTCNHEVTYTLSKIDTQRYIHYHNFYADKFERVGNQKCQKCFTRTTQQNIIDNKTETVLDPNLLLKSISKTDYFSACKKSEFVIYTSRATKNKFLKSTIQKLYPELEFKLRLEFYLNCGRTLTIYIQDQEKYTDEFKNQVIKELQSMFSKQNYEDIFKQTSVSFRSAGDNYDGSYLLHPDIVFIND